MQVTISRNIAIAFNSNHLDETIALNGHTSLSKAFKYMFITFLTKNLYLSTNFYGPTYRAGPDQPHRNIAIAFNSNRLDETITMNCHTRSIAKAFKYMYVTFQKKGVLIDQILWSDL